MNEGEIVLTGTQQFQFDRNTMTGAPTITERNDSGEVIMVVVRGQQQIMGYAVGWTNEIRIEWAFDIQYDNSIQVTRRYFKNSAVISVREYKMTYAEYKTLPFAYMNEIKHSH